jgi:hypothetical protein
MPRGAAFGACCLRCWWWWCDLGFRGWG